MTHKEMSEIFAVMLLAYPNAEVFKGGIAKLGPTINLWVTALPDVDFWTGQQAVYKLVRECKYPPTIAEFKEKADKVKGEIQSRISMQWDVIKLEIMCDGVAAAEQTMRNTPEWSQVLALMGGSLEVTRTWDRGDGSVSEYKELNYSGFAKAYETILRRENVLTDKPQRPAIGAERKQLEGKRS